MYIYVWKSYVEVCWERMKGLCTYKNKEKLEEVLYEIIPTIRLMEFNSSKVDRKYCIKTFNGSIDTILPVIKRVAN